MMLKPNSEDSYLTYSTCSLNPVENEAVVYAALKKLNEDSGVGEEFELVDCRDKLLPFKTRPGLLNWKVHDSLPRHRRRKRVKKANKIQKEKDAQAKQGEGDQEKEGEGNEEDDKEEMEVEEEEKEEVKEDENKEEGSHLPKFSFDDYFNTYDNPESIPETRQMKFKPSFFPPEGTAEEIESKYHLSRCIRVFPNDQNTSGFFIALFRRKPIHTPQAQTNEEGKAENPEEEKIVPIQKPLKNMIR